MPRPKGTHQDLSGRRFAFLTPVCRVYKANSHHTFWRCVCDCGAETVVNAFLLKDGSIKSCGCMRSKLLKAAHTKHGYTWKTGKRPEYAAWGDMRRRCHDPDHVQFPAYGARGIVVHPDWQKDFQSFIDHIGPRPSPKHSIDRIDNDGGYVPGNVRWATMAQQSRNKRSNRWLTYDGRTLTITDWARVTALGGMTIHCRLKAGWTVERALTDPVKRAA